LGRSAARENGRITSARTNKNGRGIMREKSAGPDSNSIGERSPTHENSSCSRGSDLNVRRSPIVAEEFVVFRSRRGSDNVKESWIVAWTSVGVGPAIVFIGCQVGGFTPPDNPMPSISQSTSQERRWPRDSLIKPKPPRDIGHFRLRMPCVGLPGEGPDSNLTKAR